MKMKARRRRPPLVAPPCAVLALFVLWGAVLLSLVDAPSLFSAQMYTPPAACAPPRSAVPVVRAVPDDDYLLVSLDAYGFCTYNIVLLISIRGASGPPAVVDEFVCVARAVWLTSS